MYYLKILKIFCFKTKINIIIFKKYYIFNNIKFFLLQAMSIFLHMKQKIFK